MNRLAAAGRIAVCLVFSISLSAQTPTIMVTPTGTAGVYTLAGQYTAQAQAHPPTGNVAFEDTTYSNAVLASAPFSSSVTSIAQNGSQSFAPVSQYNSTILVRDFDGDGKADVLFFDDANHLNFLKGNGDGTFQSGIPDSMSMPSGRLAAGDWNGDGKLDTATITATPTGNYTGTLTFSCGNLPSSVSCSFAPATLTFNGDNQPQTTTITVSTRTTSAALATSSSLRLASILALPLLAFGLRRRRKLQRGLLALFAAMLLLPATGCGGNPTTTSNSAATGQQTVTINAQTTANGGSTQSFNFSIVIER